MNYVPFVVAGTSSTNISGTKEDVHQAVKEKESPLRFIALPNWFHEAQMATLNETAKEDNAIPVNNAPQQEQQEVNEDKEVPESNRNSNPTAKPKKIVDALKDPSWVEPMQQELIQFKIQNVWVLVDCPSGVRPIGTKWVIKNKRDKRGIVIRNKARLVAQEHTHEEGIDYEEVFAPVARIEAIRLFLAYASYMGFTIYQMDKDVIFLSQDKYVGDILKKIGYKDIRAAKTPIDRENPWGKDGSGKDVELHLYRSMIGSLMYLTTSRPDIMFAVYACARHQVTPKECHLHAVKRIFRHQVTPKECHLHAVKRIFRYLKGNPKLGLWYPKESPFDLVTYSESDYGGANQDRKSTTRGCQFLGRMLIS
nr:hypothetical protein [Tanacetum cinerariifolium]